jgi:hypothetical protein
MLYSKAKLGSNGDKAPPVSDDSEQDTYEANVYLYELYYRFF